MSVIGMIDKLYGGDPVTVEPTLCLHTRSNRTTCQACAAACLTQAIVLTGLGPAVTAASCVGCGKCEAACPTGVFTLRETAGLLTKLGEGPVVSIACSRIGNGAERVKVPCHASLSPESLAAMAAGRRLILEAPTEEGCRTCPFSAFGQLASLPAQAGEVLRVFGLEGEVQIAFGSARAAALVEQANQMDRRQFLSFARLSLFAATKTVLEGEKPKAVLQDLPIGLPAGRRHFLEAARRKATNLQSRADRPHGRFPFAEVEARPGCDGCEACTSSCPTGALRLTKGEGADQLQFRPERCVACELCVESCPHGLLKLGGQVSPAAVVAGEPLTLAELRVATCKRCRKPFHGQGDYCPECRKIQAFTQSFSRRA